MQTACGWGRLGAEELRLGAGRVKRLGSEFDRMGARHRCGRTCFGQLRSGAVTTWRKLKRSRCTGRVLYMALLSIIDVPGRRSVFMYRPPSHACAAEPILESANYPRRPSIRLRFRHRARPSHHKTGAFCPNPLNGVQESKVGCGRSKWEKVSAMPDR